MRDQKQESCIPVQVRRFTVGSALKESQLYVE